MILAVVGRASKPENRSMSLAIATASGSAGQIVGPTVAVFLLQSMNWQSVFMIFAISIILVLSLLPLMRAPNEPEGGVGGKPGGYIEIGCKGPFVHDDLRWILLMWVPTGVHHRSFSRPRDRDERPD